MKNSTNLKKMALEAFPSRADPKNHTNLKP
jgi:hypothetical protein